MASNQRKSQRPAEIIRISMLACMESLYPLAKRAQKQRNRACLPILKSSNQSRQMMGLALMTLMRILMEELALVVKWNLWTRTLRNYLCLSQVRRIRLIMRKKCSLKRRANRSRRRWLLRMRESCWCRYSRLWIVRWRECWLLIIWMFLIWMVLFWRACRMWFKDWRMEWSWILMTFWTWLIKGMWLIISGELMECMCLTKKRRKKKLWFLYKRRKRIANSWFRKNQQSQPKGPNGMLEGKKTLQILILMAHPHSPQQQRLPLLQLIATSLEMLFQTSHPN